jgi:hypothetical protein
MDLREEPQLMEKYTQPIPRISNMVRPPQAYIRRPLHGERGIKLMISEGRFISESYSHCDRGTFEQDSRQRDLGESIVSTSMVVRNFLCFH